MLERSLLQDLRPEERKQALADNCDKLEEVTYRKPFTPEEIQRKRVELENVSIEISDLEQQKKDYLDALKMEMKPLTEIHKKTVKELKEKSMKISENCYAYLDEESRMMGYYNSEGLLVSSRPATVQELQKTIQMEIRTGTNG